MIGCISMRIRNFREKDLPEVAQIYQEAMKADELVTVSGDDFVQWFTQPELDALANAFVVSDDDDELNTWGQAGTLDGLDGEIVGYTLVTFRQDGQGYHFLCEGTVLPQYRRQHVGRILLVGACNRARLLASEFEFEAEQEGVPIYFEALLPVRDAAAARLAAKHEMQATAEPAPAGLCLYRCTL